MNGDKKFSTDSSISDLAISQNNTHIYFNINNASKNNPKHSSEEIIVRNNRAESLISDYNSKRLYDHTREVDFKYVKKCFIPIILLYILIILVNVILPTYPPVYFIQINHKNPNNSTNIKLAFFQVRYNHELWSYYSCFNDCYDDNENDETLDLDYINQCKNLNMNDVIENFIATCKDYNNAKIVFLSVSKLFFLTIDFYMSNDWSFVLFIVFHYIN